MPTVIGLIFFFTAMYCFLFREEALLGVLLVSCVFEAASALNIGGRGVQPYYIVAVFVVARAIVNKLLGLQGSRMSAAYKWLAVFGLVSVASAFISPIIFAGIPIYDPKIGIDPGLFIRPPLQFGINNIVQAAYLALHIAVAFSLLAIRTSFEKTFKAFRLAFYIEVCFVCAESVCQLVSIPFPLTLVLNNPGYSLWSNSMEAYGTRNPGTFSEPSVVGVFMVLYCGSFFAQYFMRKSGPGKAFISLAVMYMIASTTSLFAVCVTIFFLILFYSPFRFPWYLNLTQAKRVLGILLVTIIPLAALLVFSSGFRAVLSNVTVDKGSSSSFFNRTASDLYALHLTFQTYGIGVGLGSSRSSSFLANSLGTIGVLGTLAFIIFCFKIIGDLPEEFRWLKWGLFAFFLNFGISVPDVTLPLLWGPLLLTLLLGSRANRRNERKQSALQPSIA